MSNLSVKSVTNRHGFVVTLEETGKGHIKVWGNGVTLAQEQTIELRDWLNERYPTQPAAGEPDQQTAINADDLPTKKYPLGAFNFDAPVAAGEPVSPVVNYAEEVDLIRAVLEGYSPSIARSDALCSVRLLKAYFAAPPAAAHGGEAVRKDAERLDFILTKCRKVTVEMLPRGRDVYVEEGVFGDRTYPAIHRDADWEAGSPEDMAIKREAIDAAMRAQAGEGGEV